MSEKTESTTPWLDIAVDVRSPIPYMQQCMRDAVLAFNSKHESPPSTSGTDRSHLTERRSGPRVKLRLSLGNDPACRFQWVPFSKINWKRYFESKDCVVSAFYLRSSLIHKDKLQQMMYEAAEQKEIPRATESPYCNLTNADMIPTLRQLYIPTVSVSHPPEMDPVQLVEAMQKKGSYSSDYVIKHSRGANGNDIFIARGIDELSEKLHLTRDKIPKDTGTWLVQQYIGDIVLANKRKFTLRVNVLAVGNLCVYVHDQILCHIAPSEYGRPGDVSGDITNRLHNATIGGETVTLPRLFHDYPISENAKGGLWDRSKGEEQCCQRLLEACRESVASIFELARSKDTKSKTTGAFLPTENCFEVFGFDFLPKSNGELTLLEINDGPCLASVAMPEVHRCLIQEILEITLVPLMQLFERYKITQGDSWLSEDFSPDLLNGKYPNTDFYAVFCSRESIYLSHTLLTSSCSSSS